MPPVRARSRLSRLAVGVEDHNGVRVLHLAGELDVYTANRLRHAIAEWDAHERPLVIDLLRVELIDSSGLGVLASVPGRGRTGSRPVALVSDGLLREVLRIAGLDDAFVHTCDVGGACGAVRGTPASTR